MRKICIIAIFSALFWANNSYAVLKEKDLSNTLSVLRNELTSYYNDLSRQDEELKAHQTMVFNDLMSIMSKSQQNSLMLYSQKPDYIFDLTYACHEATEQYAQFQKNVLPFRSFIQRNDFEIARYDSLITNLSSMNTMMLDAKSKTDRNVCLTLAVNIRRNLHENSTQYADYIKYYQNTEDRLKHLNDYANQRYKDIQTSIFKNGGDNYFSVLRNLGQLSSSVKTSIEDKYMPIKKLKSQWDVRVILTLFFIIFISALIATLINIVVVNLLQRRDLLYKPLQSKRICLIFTGATITLALLLGLLRMFYKDQNFVIMASGLLVGYVWLLSVILISLLIRLKSNQMKNAYRIYAPLIVIGFIVIFLRIVLIPNDIVNITFPPILLICAIWQYYAVRRATHDIPRSDVTYAYVSLVVFCVSVICSWVGYTLLSVQLLIWWIMQLSCILTITCISGLLKSWADNKHFEEKEVTKTWFYRFIYQVVMPVMGVLSIFLSIYWAADVFNLSSTTMEYFSKEFIKTKGLSCSIQAVIKIVCLYLLFNYIYKTAKDFLTLHFKRSDASTASSRSMMVEKILQIVVWGIWLLISLAILNVNTTWLVVISGGLSTGIGFALKDIIENIYYGISLMAGRIKVGDMIICDGIRGKVSSISYTSTMIDSVDGSVIAFQNSQLFTKNYKNMTRNHGYEMLILEVGVAYGTDIKQVKELIIDAVSKLDCVYKRRPVSVVLKEFADSSIVLKILVWVSTITQYGDGGLVLECVYNTLNENNIEIPFPQRDIHIITQS